MSLLGKTWVFYLVPAPEGFYNGYIYDPEWLSQPESSKDALRRGVERVRRCNMMNLGLKLTEHLCNTFEALSWRFSYTKGGMGVGGRRETRSSASKGLP